jgi:hypothetical protein
MLSACSFHVDHSASLPYFLEKVYCFLSELTEVLCMGLFPWETNILKSFLDHLQRSSFHDLSNKGYLQVAFDRLCKSQQSFS